MSTIVPSLESAEPTPKPSHAMLFKRLHRRLPVYPLSAACMLLGCYGLIHALKGEAHQVSGLIGLLFVINFYEAAVIGLGLLLARRARTGRDARLLLVLAVLFACDGAYLVGEIGQTQVTPGLIVAPILWAVAMGKLGLIAGLLNIRRGATAWFATAGQMAVIMAAGAAYHALAVDGVLALGIAYAFWWLAGAMIAMGPALAPEPVRGVARWWRQPLILALALLPPFMMLVHLIGPGWVYRAHFTPAFAAPVVLGLAAWFYRAARYHPRLGPPIVGALCLTVIAAMLAFDNPPALRVDGAITIAPFRLTMLAIAALWACLAWVYRDRWPWALVGASLVFAVGSTPHQIGRGVEAGGDHAGRLATAIIPRTSLGWSVLAVMAAFVLLAAGATMSLWRFRRRG